MTLTFELDLNGVEMNQRAEYLDQRSGHLIQRSLSGHIDTPPVTYCSNF